MKRTPFKRKIPALPQGRQCDYAPRPRAVAVAIHDGKARMVVPVPKANRLRSEDYRRLVASLPCAHCGIVGFSQCAHGDEGKGLSIKSSDDTCYPACCPRPGEPGCHHLIGASGQYTRDERRELEQRYAAQTRQQLKERP